MAENKLPEGIKTVIYWAIGIGIVALIVLILSILFGNLLGNTGFSQQTTSFINETINLSDTGNTPATATSLISYHPTLSAIEIYDEDSGELIFAGNYTQTGLILTSADAEYNSTGVNVSGTVTYDTQELTDQYSIIQNYTKSGTNLTSQFPVTGTLIGVATLLIILLGVLGFAIKKMLNITSGSGGMSGGGKFGESSSSFG